VTLLVDHRREPRSCWPGRPGRRAWRRGPDHSLILFPSEGFLLLLARSTASRSPWFFGKARGSVGTPRSRYLLFWLGRFLWPWMRRARSLPVRVSRCARAWTARLVTRHMVSIFPRLAHHRRWGPAFIGRFYCAYRYDFCRSALPRSQRTTACWSLVGAVAGGLCETDPQPAVRRDATSFWLVFALSGAWRASGFRADCGLRFGRARARQNGPTVTTARWMAAPAPPPPRTSPGRGSEAFLRSTDRRHAVRRYAWAFRTSGVAAARAGRVTTRPALAAVEGVQAGSGGYPGHWTGPRPRSSPSRIVPG